MKPSVELKKFGLQFVQDLHLRGKTMEELLRSVLSPFMGEERKRLRAFIDAVLDAGLPDAELHKLRSATPSAAFFHEAEGLRYRLRAARDRL